MPDFCYPVMIARDEGEREEEGEEDVDGEGCERGDA